MIGVVLWSDPEEKKAVFWCEDQGDLAYFDGPDQNKSPCEKFSAGDMVEFDLLLDRKFRKAINAALIEERACSDFQDNLRQSAEATRSATAAARSANVVPFKAA